jgi:iron complex outermembrane receptor protein
MRCAALRELFLGAGMQWTSRETPWGRRPTWRRSWRRAWLLCGTAFLAIAWAAPGRANEPPALAAEAPEDRTFNSAQVAFDIPSGPLEPALKKWAQSSNLKLLVPSNHLSAVSTKGLAGTYTPVQALKQLLKSTTLKYALTGSRSIAVYDPTNGHDAFAQVTTLPAINVEGQQTNPNSTITPPPAYAGGQVATGGQVGLLGNRGVMDTPFNQTSYTAKKAQDQQARSIRDVLIDDPSVRAYAPDGGIGRDNLFIRGFDAGGGVAVSYGGLYGIAPNYSPMVELAERVEVLKGPAAMLNGMSPDRVIGGTVNIVPKRAPNEALTQITTSYISESQIGGHIDVARRYGADKQFGVRFNGVYRAGETPVQYNSDERGLAVLGLDFRGERVRISTDVGFQSQHVDGLVPYLGVATGVPLPQAPDARKNVGQPWTFIDHKDVFGTVRAEVDLTERVTAYAALGAHDFRMKGLWTGLITASNVNGDALGVSTTSYDQYTRHLTGETGLRARIETGPIDHELAVSATAYTNENGSASVNGPTFNTNFYNPTVIAQPNLVTPVAAKTSTQDLSSLGFADTLSVFDKRIQLTVGARFQRVQAANFAAATGVQTSQYDESAVTPSVALVVKPWQNVSIYGNYIQGLQQGTVVGSTYANAGQVFPPYKTEQYEAGVKVDWGRLTTTASVFQIAQPSTLIDVTTNTQFVGGEQRNRGLELNFFGEVSPGVRLLGGAMFLDAKLTQTQGGLTDGWTAPFAPTVNLNLSGEWDLPFVPGLTMSGRMVYTSSQFIDTTSPRRSLPEWTRFDIGARYTFENPAVRGKQVVARFNVDNAFDSTYWAGGNFAQTLVLGSPRTYRLSLTADF